MSVLETLNSVVMHWHCPCVICRHLKKTQL